MNEYTVWAKGRSTDGIRMVGGFVSSKNDWLARLETGVFEALEGYLAWLGQFWWLGSAGSRRRVAADGADGMELSRSEVQLRI
jgi:hypothetical protein